MVEKVQEERRRRTKRRAKRGLVAGYIHELSARHRESPRVEAPRPEGPPRLSAGRGTMTAG